MLLRASEGETIGYKVGLTSKAMQTFCGINHPIGGVVLKKREYHSGATVRRGDYGRLGLEFAHETQLGCSDDELAALLREVINRDFPEQKFTSRDIQPVEAEPETADQRSATRHPLIWWGDLHHGSHSWHVRLRNISASGALIQCPGTVRADSEVLLELHKAGALTASVSWAVGDHLGLKFDEPFDLRKLSQARPRVTPPSWMRPVYLENEVQPDSPWDEAWSRMSVDDLRTELEGYLKR